MRPHAAVAAAAVAVVQVACTPAPGGGRAGGQADQRAAPTVAPPTAATPAPPSNTPPTAAMPTAAPPGASAPTSFAPDVRARFAAALATLHPGSTAAEVEAALGRPDDIRTELDPGGIRATRTVEVWRWGSDRHLGFGTLGTVHIQADRTVQYVFGGDGQPPAPAVIDEATLRHLLRVIDRVPSYDDRPDPLALIQAVNALHAVGRDRAVAALREYLRVSSWLDDPGREGTFLIVRTLFDVPDPPGHFPAMMVGAPSPPAPSDPRAVPRYPIEIVDDIPIRLVRGYMLGGLAQPPEDHLEQVVKTGVMRARPLAPPADPLATFERIAGAPHTAFLRRTGLDDDGGRGFVLDQGLALIATVSTVTPSVDGDWLPAGDPVDRAWPAVRGAALPRAIAWDPTGSRYTFTDGTTNPAPAATGYRRHLWDAPLPGTTTARVILERRSPDVVDVEIRIERAAGAASPAATVRLVGPAGPVAAVPVAADRSPGNSTSGSVHGQRVTLPAGQSVRVELDVAGTVSRSAPLQP